MHKILPGKEGIHRLAIMVGAIVLMQCMGVAVQAQDSAYLASRDKLIKTLNKKELDKSWSQNINAFYFKTCDSLIANDVMVEDRPIKVILTRLFDACQGRIDNRSISVLRIPSVNNYFLETLKSYTKQSLETMYRQIGITQSGILASAFDGLVLGDSISLIVGVREMLNNPYFISKRIGDSQYIPLQDTLLYYLANGSPQILTNKLTDNEPVFTSLVNNSRNMTVRAVAQVPRDMYYENVIPFGLAILDSLATADSIRKLSLVPPNYYSAFVNEIIRLHTSGERERKFFLEEPLVELNKRFANKYYISEINALHDAPDNVRFQILNKLSPRELYFLLIGGSGELYTSSFFYLYKKFIKDVEKEGLDAFLKSIEYYQFGQFVTNISIYGLVDDLIQHLKEEKFAALMTTYFRQVLSSQLTDNQIILNAMTISEILNAINHQPIVQSILLKQIETYEKLKIRQDVMLQRMFAGFKSILMNKTDYTTDPIYDVLPVSRLQKDNRITQVSFFYDDEDGVSSFESSISTYDPKIWEKTDMGNYIVFKSIAGNNMSVFMNKPMTTPGSDSSQDEMLRAIDQAGLEVSSFIHRGHSYHIQQSLRKITPSAEFVFLGSCGGYNEVLNVFQLNPDVNIIVTRNIGSKLINDPLLQKINTHLVNDEDVNWDATWNEFNKTFSSKRTQDLFSSYIPPNKYIGMKFIRKVLSY